MPTRMLRDWTDSEAVNALSAEAERFFVRLIQKADDFGRYTGDPKLLRPYLFPLLLESTREANLERWIAECVKARLVRRYEVGGKPYLVIEKFGQRVRAEVSKFPEPPPADECRADDGQMPDSRPARDGPPRTETKAKSEAKARGGSGADAPRSRFVPPTEEEWVEYARATWADWPEHDIRSSWASYEAKRWKGSPEWRACAKTCYHRQAAREEPRKLRALVGAHPRPAAVRCREITQESPAWVIAVAKVAAHPARPVVPDDLEAALREWQDGRREDGAEPEAWTSRLTEALGAAIEEDRRLAGGRVAAGGPGGCR